MNFRVNLAVALAAAVSFACGGKPAPSADLASSSEAVKIGSYRMTVTPVAGTNEVLFSIIPIGGDGNPNTNPPGKLQIRGQFRATISAAGQNGNPCGEPAVDAAVLATNFATETLTNLWVRVAFISTGFTACNSDNGTLPPGMPTTNPAGRWSYGNLTGAPNATGTAAGQAASKTWWFRYPSATPQAINFDAFATIPLLPTPSLAAQGAVPPLTPLSWTLGASTSSTVEVCAAEPLTAGLFDPYYGLCPAGSGTITQVPSGTTLATTGLSTSIQYYWRVGNGPAATLFSPWTDILFLGPPGLVAPATGASIAQNAPAFNLSWNYDIANSSDWGTSLLVCTEDPCVNPVAGFPLAIQHVDPVSGLNLQDFVGLAPADPGATVAAIPANWILPGTYWWSVAYQPTALGLPGAYGAARSFTVTAVSPVPAGVTYTAATTTLAWTTAPEVAGTFVMLYDQQPGTNGFDNLNIVGASGGDPGVALLTPGSWELVLPFAPAALTTYWYEVYVADFFAIDLTTQLPFTTTLKASGSFTTP